MANIAITQPPAKLNLFLELLGKRDDGFHEIDTVMTPIDWCDRLRVERTEQREITLTTDWTPSVEIMASRLGVHVDDALLQIPTGDGNLVYRALDRFLDRFKITSGFHCELNKCIPAGAGMGGASSDAASALRCAAMLHDIPPDHADLFEIAAEIGSDVPFFLGLENDPSGSAGRAQGRGEKLSLVKMRGRLDFVVVYPNLALSTGKVYAASQLPEAPETAVELIQLLETGRFSEAGKQMMNRLSDPAKKLAPQIGEILESLWQVGLRTCQLTGSGSACFAIAGSRREAIRCSAQLRALLEPGAIVVPARSTHVPALVNLT